MSRNLPPPIAAINALMDSDPDQALAMAEAAGLHDLTVTLHLTLAGRHQEARRFKLAHRHLEAAFAIERQRFGQALEAARAEQATQTAQAQAMVRAEAQRAERAEAALKAVQSARQGELAALKTTLSRQFEQDTAALRQALKDALAERERLTVRLALQSRTDALTGLSNRRELEDRLRTEFAASRRYATPVALALCDVDGVRSVNEQFGQAAGDAVLRRVAEVLRSRCRSTDLVARLGSDEFCVVFAQTEGVTALGVCESLRLAIEQQAWGELHPELAVSVSIGVAAFTGQADPERLLALADRHLYRAKASGRNRVSGPEEAPRRA